MGVGTRQDLVVTRTGRTVLRALRSYIVSRNPDVTQIPGHEVTETFRSEADARAVIKGVPGLYDALLAARLLGFDGHVSYRGANIAGGAAANGKAMLALRLQENVARVLEAATLASRKKVEFQEPVHGIFVERISPPVSSDGTIFVEIAGPHDVMRFLAYDLHAAWM
jgi:hypothetical protein